MDPFFLFLDALKHIEEDVLKVVENRLVEVDGTVAFVSSPHTKSNFNTRYVLIHNTEGPTAAGAITTLTNPKSTNKASAHVVVDVTGEVTQLVKLDRVANHAGRSFWAGLSGLSRFSFGIEIVNEGRLAKATDASGREVWRGPSGRLYAGDQVFIGAHKLDPKLHGWKTYPQVQLDKVFELCELLIKTYNLIDVLGHDEVSPKRKWDPSPAFPISDFRNRLFGRDDPLF